MITLSEIRTVDLCVRFSDTQQKSRPLAVCSFVKIKICRRKRKKSVFLIRNDDDFSPVVISAVFANSVVQLLFVALRAFNQGRSADFPISRSGVLSLLRSFSFRYCHIFRLPLTYIVLVHDKSL